MADDSIARSVAQWESFCDELKSSGRDTLQTAAGMDAVTQAEGLRYLTRLMRGGVERFVEYWDPLNPILPSVYTEHLKWGMDNPDSIYRMGGIDGSLVYEINGNIGDVPYFNFTSAKTGTNARQEITGFLDGENVNVSPSGDYVIIAGGPEQSRNWIRLEPDSNTLMCRETYTDRSTQAEMTCNITLLSDIDATQPITIEQALQRSISTQQFFTNTSKTFLGLSKLMAEHVNVLPVVSPDLMKAMGGDPNYLYYWASFIVQPDEALTIHFPTVSECENWGLCLYNHWLESLDHTRSQINLNKFTAKQNDDESMTIIVSDQAPPGGNWLDTQKHTRGNMMFRWTRVKDVVHPKTKLVKLNEANWNALLKRWPG